MFLIFGLLFFGFFLLFPIFMVVILAPLIRRKYSISNPAAIIVALVLFIAIIGLSLVFLVAGEGSHFIIMWIIIALSFAALFLICLAGSVFGAAEKRLTVFYDLSDFFLTFSSFFILRFALSGALKIINGAGFDEAFLAFFEFITFRRYMDMDILLILISLFLTVALAVYSFYMSYQYNKSRKIAVVFSFFGRYTSTGAIAFSFPLIARSFATPDFFVYSGGNFFNISLFFAAGTAFILILILAAYIRYFRFSYFETFLYPSNIKALGRSLVKDYPDFRLFRRLDR